MDAERLVIVTQRRLEHGAVLDGAPIPSASFASGGLGRDSQVLRYQ